jgi:nucleoside-diphosphate-sugar epimerase
MPLPRLIITGASGFLGQRLLSGLREEFEIVGLARRSQARCGVPQHQNVSWFQTDIGDPESVATAFRFVRETGGADYVIHLAAHYDFTGEDHPEYRRTNVDGMRRVLEECRSLDLKRFIFASSLAACRFPAPGGALDETSPPDGEHTYAWSKRMGEELLAEFESDVPSAIIRLAAVYSDWCEYAPLHVFIDTWLSGAWNARIIGGRGASAIPYIHARELPGFMRRVIGCNTELPRRQVLIASPNHTVSHLDLYRLVARYCGRTLGSPIHVSAPLARIGVWGRDLLGRLTGNRPFERPWMVEYIDEVLAVNANATYKLIGWKPRPRLYMDCRMAFILDHRTIDPVEWTARNQAAEKVVHLRPNLKVHRLLERHQDRIRRRYLAALVDAPDSAVRFPFAQHANPRVLEWRFTVALRHILNSVRAQDRGLFLAYCRDLAEKRIQDGVGVGELIDALRLINNIALEILVADPDAEGLDAALYAYLTMTVEFGCDQVLEVYEDLSGVYLEDEE